jgi:hypothetical protein
MNRGENYTLTLMTENWIVVREVDIDQRYFTSFAFFAPDNFVEIVLRRLHLFHVWLRAILARALREVRKGEQM